MNLELVSNCREHLLKAFVKVALRFDMKKELSRLYMSFKSLSGV